MHLRQSQFVVLAPSWLSAKQCAFSHPEADGSRYVELLAQMQRLRGRIYLNDDAINRSDLTSDGRHALPIDERSWHILTMDEQGKISGCLRFLEESKATRFEDLWISHAALVHCP